MFVIFRKAWNDSVLSKVIAAGITAVLAGLAGLAFNHWIGVADVLTTSVLVPVWLLLLGALVLLVVVVWSLRPRPTSEPEPDAHPNAVLVARDTRLLGRPFESLSERQQQFLAQQFGRGMRTFSPPVDVEQSPWFLELKRWNYVRPRQAIGLSLFEIGEAAWQELEKLRRENGRIG
jgi:hypothetical protein